MWRRYGEFGALLVLLAIVALRPLIGESFHTAGTNLTAALPNTEDPRVATTLVLDALVLVIAAAVTVGRAARRSRMTYRRTGMEWGALFLLIAAAASTAMAADKRPAMVASMDLMAAIALCLALVQLLDASWKLRLALAVVVASGVATAGLCAEQQLWSFAETDQDYLKHREALWAQQGVALDAPQVRLFEQRMRSREAAGAFAHSNVAGAYLLLGGFGALALAVSVRRSYVEALVAAGLLGAILLTKSLGAVVAAGAGLVLVAVSLRFWEWLSRHRRAVLTGGCLLGLAGAAAVVTVGTARGTLGHPSLDFRWQYWTASWSMFADHLWFGVGAENFGDAYLEYKSIASPEEVKNPHNLFVHVATEYGACGLLAMVMMLGGAVLRFTQPSVGVSVKPTTGEPQARNRIAILMVLAGLVFGCRTRLLSSSDPNFVYWATMFPLLFWFSAAVAMGWPKRAEGCDSASAGVPRGGVVLGCGLLAFLLQEQINFALFVPGARTTFFAALAVTFAFRNSGGDAEPGHRAAAWAGAGVCCAAAIAALLTLAAPLRAESALHTARSIHMPPTPDLHDHPRYQSYRHAINADPLDATAPAELAQWFFALARNASASAQAGAWIDAALDANRLALDRAPHRYALWRKRSMMHLFAAEAGAGVGHTAQAIDAARAALALYPRRPEGHVELGDCLSAAQNCADWTEALSCYAQALALDDARPAWEEFRRFSASQRAEIEARRIRVRRLLDASCPETP